MVRIALVQFDSLPERVDENLRRVESLARQAAASGARWILFHENTLCDYSPHPEPLAQETPGGPAVTRLRQLAHEIDCVLGVGLAERDAGRCYITHLFVGPEGVIHRYRKTWLWFERSDEGYRDEWRRFDPGSGPEAFSIDGVRATCFICSDGESSRCIERAAALRPAVVVYPNNRAELPGHEVFGARAKAIGAPMLVTNRTGTSWCHRCVGGCVVYGADGSVLAAANREGREEILTFDLRL